MTDQSGFPQIRHRVAVGVVRGEVPEVYLAENVEVLGRLLAVRVVARARASHLTPGSVDEIRLALLEERWGDAVYAWMTATDNVVDGYDDEHVWTEERLDAELTSFEIRLSPIFQDDEPADG